MDVQLKGAVLQAPPPTFCLDALLQAPVQVAEQPFPLMRHYPVRGPCPTKATFDMFVTHSLRSSRQQLSSRSHQRP